VCYPRATTPPAGHPGLQHMYLRYKSFQRFTETYALLERAEARAG
jgi:hypothetical protein